MTVGPSRRADVFERSLEDEVVLYDSQGSVMHTLNATATAIWMMCDGQHAPEEMAQQFCKHFGIEPDQAHQDVLTTLEQLREKNLRQET